MWGNCEGNIAGKKSQSHSNWLDYHITPEGSDEGLQLVCVFRQVLRYAIW